MIVQNQKKIDSLNSVVNGSYEDSIKIDALLELGSLFKNNRPDSALWYFEKALSLSEQIKSPSSIAFSRRNIGMVKESMGLYDQAMEEYFTALDVYEQAGNKHGIASSYNAIAIVHYLQESYELCMEYLTKSFEIKRELGDKQGMANYFTNMSALKTSLEAYEEALGYSEQSLELFEELDDKIGLATAYGNIGSINSELRNYKISLENHLKSVELYQEIDNKDGIAHSLSNVAGLYLQMADSLARNDSQRKEYLNQAESYGLRCYSLAEDLGATYIKNYVANTLHGAYKALGKPWKALEYAEIFISTRDTLFNEEKTRAIEEMDTKYETEKKQQQIELQKSQIIARDAKIQQQKTLRNALIAGLLSVILIIVIVVYAYFQKRRDNRKIKKQNKQIQEANEELKQLNDEIHAQKEEIESQRDQLEIQRDLVTNQKNEILDSINYAERIQSAIMPPELLFTELLDEVFILFKPRDIVSGDFYWIKQVNQYIILAAADCTGHGIPGAFMSMLGISYLNEIVQRREITQANQILNEMRSQIKHSLRQHGQPDDAKDGIDMALCVINKKTSIMQYSGANNPLYLIKDVNGMPELQEYKADRMPLGYYLGKDKPFTNQEIKLEMGDTFYMFSDGFIDQKGGKDNRKFMSKNFKKLLLEIHDQPMYDQKHHLEKTLEAWMPGQTQIDDILVIGVRV